MNNRFNVLSLILLLASGLVNAGGVTVGGTRLIYDGGKNEAPLNVTNSDVSPYLIQSWVETPEGGVEKAPFIITPPLFRLEGNQQNILRVVRTGGNLPNDRESLFWLNVKTIPSGSKKEGANTLQIAVKTRIKLLFRPQGLRGVPEDMADRLTWSQSGNQLTVTNPTPFIMNFQSVKVGGHEIKNVTYVMPQSQAIFPLQTGTSGPISWRLISDYGGTGDLHTNGH
ncbi:molecular chaperone [Serratia fonticola]|uniref:fimbrial biogenesis chaperone n=1 Tax=Serratia fonticola TaxID=47917 RepID=UPI001378DA1F|nr:molecular chaperone [Serratia fonticola]NCG55172.1 fimbria/pilus periplasmic chaperone [Serratia fonticola]